MGDLPVSNLLRDLIGDLHQLNLFHLSSFALGPVDILGQEKMAFVVLHRRVGVHNPGGLIYRFGIRLVSSRASSNQFVFPDPWSTRCSRVKSWIPLRNWRTSKTSPSGVKGTTVTQSKEQAEKQRLQALGRVPTDLLPHLRTARAVNRPGR